MNFMCVLRHTAKCAVREEMKIKEKLLGSQAAFIFGEVCFRCEKN